MKVKELIDSAGFGAVSLPEPDREIGGCYTGDLLSWVMGRVKADDVWITIMSNINIVAVASLADTSCIILAEGVTLDESIIKTAQEKGVNIISSDLAAYETAVRVYENIKI